MSKSILMALLCILLLLPVGCKDEDEQSPKEVVNAFAKAIENKDFDTASSYLAYQYDIKKFFEDLPEKVEVIEVETTISPGHAECTWATHTIGTAKFRITAKGKVKNVTMGLQRQRDYWRIIPNQDK
jgi:hypothetical protein